MGKAVFSVSNLLAAGSSSFAIGWALISTDKFPEPFTPFSSEHNDIGLASIYIALVLFAGAFIKWLGNVWRSSNLHVSASSLVERLVVFDDSYALPSDLSEVCTLGRTSIGDHHSTADLLRNRIEKCPHIIKKLTSPNRSKILGYYIIYPLTKRGINRIDKKQIMNGKSLVDTDIAASFRAAKAVYISMIFGDGLMAKAATLLHLKKDLKHHREMNSSIRKFYAKPSSKDGLRLLKQYGFRPIDSETGIWVLAF